MLTFVCFSCLKSCRGTSSRFYASTRALDLGQRVPKGTSWRGASAMIAGPHAARPHVSRPHAAGFRFWRTRQYQASTSINAADVGVRAMTRLGAPGVHGLILSSASTLFLRCWWPLPPYDLRRGWVGASATGVIRVSCCGLSGLYGFQPIDSSSIQRFSRAFLVIPLGTVECPNVLNSWAFWKVHLAPCAARSERMPHSWFAIRFEN